MSLAGCFMPSGAYAPTDGGQSYVGGVGVHVADFVVAGLCCLLR